MLVVRWSADKPGRIGVRIRLARSRDARVETSADHPDRLIQSGRVDCKDEATGQPKGMHFEAQLRIEVKGGKVTALSDHLLVEHADEMVIRLAAATDYRGDNPSLACDRALDAAAARSFDQLCTAHVAAHQALFRRVALVLDGSTTDREAASLPTDARLARVKKGQADPGLVALYFQFGRYLLLSSSRPGTMPANLQGIWNEHMNAPWNADYHTNINIQMNYWPAEVANLAECHQPLFDWMSSIVASGEHTAKVHYGCRGWVVHHLSDPFGYTTPADGVWGIWPMGAAWLAQHAWEHFAFGGDTNFLKRQGYPLIKGAAVRA